MYFRHSAQIWNDYPKLSAGVMVVAGVNADADTGLLVEHGFERARQRLEGTTEAQMPEISAWRSVFSQMGLKPTSYRCAAESLLRRFRKENSLPSFHPLVDLYNAVSIAYAIPIAVYDIDSIADGIEVRYARGGEHHLNFRNEIEYPQRGEIVFADEDGHAHSRRWCFRQSRQSAVGPSTRRVLIVAEAQHQGGAEDIAELMDELDVACESHFEKPVLRTMLSGNWPEFSFSN